MRRHTPRQQFIQAVQMAVAHGMFVVDKSVAATGKTMYLVYRKTVPNPCLAGKCSSASALFNLVDRLATTK